MYKGGLGQNGDGSNDNTMWKLTKKAESQEYEMK